MKSLGSRRGGYTVVETLIYLAVTGSLFVGAAMMISGQQARTEFTQTVREVESFLRDVSNDVSTGYYPNPGGFECIGGVGSDDPPTLTTVSTSVLGSNGDCLFLGRLFHIKVSGKQNEIDIYTLFGNRLEPVGSGQKDVETLSEADVTISDILVETKSFSEVISFFKIETGADKMNAFAFTTSLATFTTGNLEGAGLRQELFVVPGVAAGDFGNLKLKTEDDSARLDEGPISVCINSKATDAHAVIVIGGADGYGVSSPIINNGPCAL